MQRNMVRFVALDFILRVIWRRVVIISFKLHDLPMHPNNRAGDPSRFGVPRNVIANCKLAPVQIVHGYGVGLSTGNPVEALGS